jgi:UDP-2,3-diacylglucosamine pyrophosphatase LpxH
MKTILHLSDLHLSDKVSPGFSHIKASEMLKCLIKDIKELSRSKNIDIDTIFFTGDMTFSGTSEQFSKFDEVFLEPLLESLCLERSSVYFTPGNHDVDRNGVNKLEQMFRNSDDEESISEYFNQINIGDVDWKRLNGYFEYEKRHVQDAPNCIGRGKLISCYKITNKIYILCINSAWLAQDDKDQEKLRITKHQIEFIQRLRIPPDAKILALTHHPLDWLEKNDREKFSSFIEKRVNILFFGHMHRFKQKAESNFSENITIFLQAGTLDTRDSITGYSIVDFHRNNKISDGKIFYRKYNKDDNLFEPWLERGSNGEIEFNTDNLLSFDSNKFSQLSYKILQETDTDLLINTGVPAEKKKKLRDLFTQPNFIEIEIGTIGSVKIKSTEEIIYGNHNMIVLGGHSSGRSSILKYLFIISLERQVNKDFAEFAFFLDLAIIDIKSISTLINLLCQQYSTDDITTSFEEKVKKMISEGSCIIFIDNIDKITSKEEIIVSDFLSKYEKCKFIASAEQSSTVIINRLITEDNKSRYNAIAVGSLRRSNVRDMVSRWNGFSSQNVIYNEITRTINNSQLPHNYFIYSMLLSIYEVDHDIKKILSESDIIENFIEILLRKHFMDTPSNKPQYKELLHFLGYFSKCLFDRQSNFMSNNDLLQVAITFNTETMNNYQVMDYVEPLKNSGILQEQFGNISFSQPCFLYYSLAYFMKHDKELHERIISDDNYLNLDKVIEYYSSQNSSNLELLYIISGKIDKLKMELSERVFKDKSVRIEDVSVDTSNAFSILDMVSTTTDFEEKIESLKADKERDDARLDQTMPLSDEDNQANLGETRAEKRQSILDDLLESLSLYSRVFRSTELSMNREETIKIFSDLSSGYMFYLKSFVLMLDEQFVIPNILPILEKKMIESNLSEHQKKKVLEVFKLVLSVFKSTIPNNIQLIMSQELSSRKPRIANIISETRSQVVNPVEKAILTYVLMDLKEDNIVSLANEMMKEQNKIVQDSLFFKINQLLTSNYDMKKSDEDKLKNIAKKIGYERKIATPKISEAFERLNRL